jgi:hypothetical protein
MRILRFLLRGLPKVSLEVGWLSLSHNLLKKAAISQKNKTVMQGLPPNKTVLLENGKNHGKEATP